MTPIQTLAARWIEAKKAEADAVEFRRDVEDELSALLKVNPNVDGSKTEKLEGFEIKVTTRLTRKIDSDLVQEIAAEHGLSEHLATLLRWKPELDMKSWKAASETITKPLSAAITTTPGRPSFSINAITKE